MASEVRFGTGLVTRRHSRGRFANKLLRIFRGTQPNWHIGGALRWRNGDSSWRLGASTAPAPRHHPTWSELRKKRGRPPRDLKATIRQAILSSRIFNHVKIYKGERRRNLLIKDIAAELGISIRTV
jgi:hypothetical protein